MWLSQQVFTLVFSVEVSGVLVTKFLLHHIDFLRFKRFEIAAFFDLIDHVELLVIIVLMSFAHFIRHNIQIFYFFILGQGL